jgi:hypothetical protein
MAAGSASTPLDIIAQIAALDHGAGSKCNAGPFIAGLSSADQDGIRQALDAGYTMTAVGRFIVGRGYRFSPQSVVRHLSGRCSCPR